MLSVRPAVPLGTQFHWSTDYPNLRGSVEGRRSVACELTHSKLDKDCVPHAWVAGYTVDLVPTHAHRYMVMG